MGTFPIPKKALEQHIVVLGKTGRGKSSAMRGGFVEPLLDAGEPVCIIDPKGDWFGLRSAADGKRAGYRVVIFGGEHADVPINEHSGAHIAELVATGNRPCIIDLGGWMVGDRTRFFIAFASTLFKLTRGRRWLVIDECHNFAPQGKILDPDAGKMLHWANRLASEGRGKGINIIAASQRPQKVHKDFLTSMETLIAMGVVHKLDRDAVKDWIDGCADPATGKEVIASLAGLPRGEAWVWSPEIDFGPKRIAFPMFKTFDSFKPQAADAGKLKGWAEVDLDEVRTKLGAVVEQAKANDPAELKRRIRELEKQLATPGATSVDLEAAERRGWKDGYEAGWSAHAKAVSDALLTIPSLRPSIGARPENPDRSVGTSRPAVASIEAPMMQVARQGKHSSPGVSLPKAERLVLTALAQYPQGRSKTQVAILTGYAVNGGGFNNAVSALRAKGFIEGSGDRLAFTEAGLDALGAFTPLPEGPDLLRHWIGQLAKAERAALEVLADAYPKALSKEELARRAGYEPNGGGFNNALSRLRTLELVRGRGELTASEDLF